MVERFLWWGCAVLVLGGCVEKADPVRPVDKQAVSRWVSDKPTEPEHTLHTKLGDKVELIGYDLRPDEVRAGKPFTITWHWKVLEPVGEGWQLFTHVADGEGQNRMNEDVNGLIRRAYPPAQWKKGEYIRDSQGIVLPEEWSSDEVRLYLGIWKGNERLPPSGGPHDGTGRALGAKLEVKGAAEPTPLPKLVAKHTGEAPNLDGKLDEAMWKSAAVTERLVNTRDGSEAEPEARVRAAWDDAHLYIAFEVKDEHLKSSFDEHDEHLWEQDCVEVMLDPDGDGKNYFELQVSPKGVVFDTRYDSRRKPQPIGHADWDTELKNGVVVNGKVGDDEDDQGYVVEMAIPWKAFAAGKPPAEPPKKGESWRVNFYVLDALENGQRGVGWSPPRVPDFHKPDRFGILEFQ